jgi:hypothetical protein
MEKQMSNALVRKKKRMQPLGYSKSELIGIQKYAKAQNNADYLITESYYNVRMMAYQALHDMFGFGQKRIIRVEQTIETYLGDSEKDGMSAEELGYFMKTKCGIDVREETNKIPYRESFYLVERKIAPNCMIQANKFLLAQVFNYFAMLGVCLKTQFKFSGNQIRQVYERIRYLINCIATGYETMTGIASVLEHECNYIDKRFVGRTYEI